MAAAPKGMKPAAKGAPAEAAPADIASVGTGPSTDSVAGATESLPTGSAALGALREQLLLATQAFASAEQPLAKLLGGMIDDVARASAERLTIFPVCHHSPSSGLHLLRRLQTQPPKVLFIELCEDMAGILPKLAECRLPVALQAFAQEPVGLPRAWAPLSVVAPLTEFSAEFQAIAWAQQSGAELVLCDRSVDHLFQFLPQRDEELEERLPEEEDDDGAALDPDPALGPAPTKGAKPARHSAALGVQMGGVEPTYDGFLQVLLRNARVRHFAEWWDQYVEQAVIGADEDTYRHVLYLVGSLLRRLGRKEDDLRSDRLRERYMWTVMKRHLKARGLEAKDALYLCGAAHAVSDVPEFGTGNDALWDIPQPTGTRWLYGVVPSSYAAIEHQFNHPPGTVSLAEDSWDKTLTTLGLAPFRLAKAVKSKGKAKAQAEASPPVEGEAAAPAEGGKRGKAKKAAPTPAAAAATPEGLSKFLLRPPALQQVDAERLLHWSVEIVRLARANGYLASSADAIAIYQTSILLANLRDRAHPSPYDFQDAAITCLEKDRAVRRRDVRRLCEILLGGDRQGLVGYDALPALARDVLDRLAPLKQILKVEIESRNIVRALMDLQKEPALRPCSDLLWVVRYLLGDIVRPIMGQKELGKDPQQESWDLALTKNQKDLIELAYEGVTVEHVLEQRLRKAAFASKATTVVALKACEDSALYLRSARLTEELGERAVALLTQEVGATDAPEIDERVRRLLHHYRASKEGLPPWLRQFVTSGYAHFTSLLPAVFADQGARPEQVASMLAFLLTQESLALSLGCQRSQLLIAVQQAGPVTEDATKKGLLWATEWLLGLRKVEEIREALDQAILNPLLLPIFPSYISGFLLALKFTSLVARLVVELMSKAFALLPDEILLPWLPGLLMTLKPYAGDVMPQLIKEAGSCFPQRLGGLQGWTPPWETATAEPPADAAPSAEEAALAAVLRGATPLMEALAALLG